MNYSADGHSQEAASIVAPTTDSKRLAVLSLLRHGPRTTVELSNSMEKGSEGLRRLRELRDDYGYYIIAEPLARVPGSRVTQWLYTLVSEPMPRPQAVSNLEGDLKTLYIALSPFPELQARTLRRHQFEVSQVLRLARNEHTVDAYRAALAFIREGVAWADKRYPETADGDFR